MKKFLIPVDYSSESIKAIRFGLNLADKTNSSIQLLHCIDLIYDEHIVSLVTPQETRRQKQHLIDFFHKIFVDEKYKDWIRSKRIVFQIKYGFASDQILEASNKAIFLTIIVQAKRNGILKRILGSVSRTVALKSKNPVLMLTNFGRVPTIKKIAFAFNKSSVRTEIIKKWIEMANFFQSSLYLINIEANPDKSNKAMHEMAVKIIDKLDLIIPYTISSIEGVEIIHGLSKFCDYNRLSVLSFVHRKRSILSNLFHQSITKEALDRIGNTSLLIFNY